MYRLFLQVKKAVLFVVPVILFFLMSATSSYAQEINSKVDTTPRPSQIDFSATVNIKNAIVTKTEGNVFDVSFDISNDTGAQPKIIYAVDLFKKDENGVPTIMVDQKVYDDTISLGEGESLTKNISYTAPAYLSGAYMLAIEAINTSGLPFSMVPVGNVSLFGSGDYVEVNSKECSLTVEVMVKNNLIKQEYSSGQTIDISKEEKLVAHCLLKNSTKKAISAIPVLKIYQRSFGVLTSTENLPAVTIDANKTLDFALTLPGSLPPQFYKAVLTFTNKEGDQMSGVVDFNYVLRGESATIQNLTLDKDLYKKGDTAKVAFYWSSSGEILIGTRFKEKTIVENISAMVSIKNESGEVCSEEFKAKINTKNQAGIEYFSIPIIGGCTNPVVKATILNEKGEVLYENVYNIKSMEARGLSLMRAILYVAIFILVIVLIAYASYLGKKNKNIGIFLMLCLMIMGGMFIGVEETKAAYTTEFDAGITVPARCDNALYCWNLYGYTECHCQPEYLVPIFHYAITLDKFGYYTGEDIRASVSYWSIAGDQFTRGEVRSVWGTIDGVTKDLKYAPAIFTAPSTAGDYYLSIYSSAYFGEQAFTLEKRIPFFVVNRNCTGPDGSFIYDGGSKVYFSADSCRDNCVSETRTCSNGVLSGSYTNTSCPNRSCNAPCTGPDGSTIPNRTSRTYYASSCGQSCVPETRTCSNGVLSGTYTNPSCSGQACASCTGPDGSAIPSGTSRTYYASSCGQSCVPETRTCSNGVLSGTYTNPSCSGQACVSCVDPSTGLLIPSGESILRYTQNEVDCGFSCSSNRVSSTCNNGVWSNPGAIHTTCIERCPNFTLNKSGENISTQLSVVGGGATSTPITITVSPIYGFSSNVNLSASAQPNLPSGTRYIFSDPTLSSSDYTTGSQFSIFIPTSISLTPYTINITGQSGSLTKTISLQLNASRPIPSYEEF